MRHAHVKRDLTTSAAMAAVVVVSARADSTAKTKTSPEADILNVLTESSGHFLFLSRLNYRSGSKRSSATEGAEPEMSSLTSLPVPGPRLIPNIECPVATTTFFILCV